MPYSSSGTLGERDRILTMTIDIMAVKQAIRSGELKVFTTDYMIFLEDTKSKECVLIGNVNDGSINKHVNDR